MRGEPKPLVIIGAGGHAKVVMDIAEASLRAVCGVIDRQYDLGHRFLNSTIVGNEALLEDNSFVKDHEFIVAIGDQSTRRRLSLQIVDAGGSLATLRHPASVVSPHATIEAGTVLAAGCVVNPSARVGRFCILNTGCTVDHDVRLADGVQICPGANLAGTVTCEEDVFVGTGAVVIPRINIGAAAIIGAGAVVVRDVLAGTMVVGNPARPIVRRELSKL